MNIPALNFDLERELRILESLAKKHAPSSVEYASVEIAAKALLFIHATKQIQAFEKYLKNFHGDITNEQKKFLEGF